MDQDQSGRIIRFRFRVPVDPKLVEADVLLALFASECVYGAARLRIEAAYLVRDDGATVIESYGESADVAARIFAGLSAARAGELGYTVEHLEHSGGHDRAEQVDKP